MTTLVKIEVSHVNVGPGKVLAGVAVGQSVGSSVYDCPMKAEFYIHGDQRVFVREATWADLDVAEGKTVPSAVPPAADAAASNGAS